jgi:hypothetical protein
MIDKAWQRIVPKSTRDWFDVSADYGPANSPDLTIRLREESRPRRWQGPGTDWTSRANEALLWSSAGPQKAS